MFFCGRKKTPQQRGEIPQEVDDICWCVPTAVDPSAGVMRPGCSVKVFGERLITCPFKTTQLHDAMQQAFIDADHEFIVVIAGRRAA